MTKAAGYSRRSMLSLGAAAGLYGLSGIAGPSALAKGPFLNTQAPTFFRFKLGAAEATIISDGVLPLGDPHAAFLGISPGDLDSMLTNNFLPVGAATLEQNILVLNTGDKIIIFDNGMGVSKLFGDTTGKMLLTLKQAGIEAKDVDALVMTHAHIDHCGGVIGPDGKPSFPNAELFISEADFTYWTDEAKVGPSYKAFYEQAVRNLLPTNAIQSQTLKPWTIGLTVTQTLFNGFRTANSVRVAELQVQSGREALRNVGQGILLDAVTAYTNVLANQSLVEAQRSNVAFLRETLAVTQRRLNAGDVTPTDASQAEARLSRGLSDLNAAEVNLAISQATYAQVIGMAPGQLRAADPVDRLLPRSREDAIALANKENPAVAAASFDVDVASTAIKVAEGALLPSV
ncbi:MAG: TolC family protein, partial [Bradyrhizobium sp.]|nr:TolC family protein [Bradyrhizobium sp.]